MAIKFFNIRTKEVLVAETEPQIAALWSSSDHSPNITQGQDFGWRLAPEVVVRMKQIAQDWQVTGDIARRIGKNVDELTEPDLLAYISANTDEAHAPVAREEDYTDEYNEEIRRLERQMTTDETVTTTTTEVPTTTTTTTKKP